MNDAMRARVAAVVVAAHGSKSVSCVYDYDARRYRNVSAEVSESGLAGYDYETRSHFSGGGAGSLDFYDYEARAHVQLSVDRDSFSGYDYCTRHHFSGTVASGSVSLYDYHTRKYYNFSA